jgi:N-acetylmuramoyl-L-alanine amidase
MTEKFTWKKHANLTPVLLFCSLLLTESAHANTFGQRDIPTDRVVAVASPYGEGQHQLLVIQQLDAYQRCWSEYGTTPTKIDPLLVNFDFTGICGRSIDSNGYSVRLAGQDLGWRYSLSVVKRDRQMLLIGTPTGNKNAPELLIGSVNGVDEGFTKINLNAGWRMAQRTYSDQVLGHIYFTNDQPLAAFAPIVTPIATAAKSRAGFVINSTEVPTR